ncbi:MAG: alpha/beta hydrolase [Myxococcota bacterium]|nr:alpha/beta hydrolase [Myxococcota bacterium]
MPKKYLQVGGFATYVQHTGPSTLPQQPPAKEAGESVVCLHGAGSHGEFFMETLGALEGRHGVFVFDQPGHGRSGSLDSLGSVQKMAEFTQELCDVLGLDRPVLLGHDMGGAVALQMALNQPERVRALIIAACGARVDITDETLSQAQRVSEGKERRPFDPSNFSGDTAPEVMKKAFMWGLKTDPRATYGDLLACRDWKADEELDRIKAPVLVIHGSDEHENVRTRAAELVEKAPEARLEILSGAGHALLPEAPDALAEAVDTFLGGLH